MFLVRHPFLVIFTIALLESMLLAKVGNTIGWGLTIALILLSTMLGSLMLRQQGFQTFRRLQLAMGRGENPGPDILEGVLIMAGGLLLMTPGFLTDSIGFLLLIPPTRKALLALIVRRLADLPQASGIVRDQWTYSYRAGGNPFQATEGFNIEQPPFKSRDPAASDSPDGSSDDVEVFTSPTRPAPEANSHVPDVIEGEFSRKED